MKWVILLAICFVPYGYFGGFYNPNLLAGWAVIFFGLAFLLFRLATGKERKTSVFGLVLSALPFVSVVTIWLFNSHVGLSVYIPYACFYLLLFLAFFIISSNLDQDSAGNIEVANRVFLILGIMLTVASVRLPGYPNVSVVLFDYVFRLPLYFGSLNQPNNFATGLASIIAFSVWSCFETRKISLFSVVAWGVLSVGIFLTGSKAGYLSLILISGWMAIFCRDPLKLRLLLLLIIATGIGFFVTILLDGLGINLSRDFKAGVSSFVGEAQGIRDKSTIIRLSLLKSAWAIGLDSPLIGHGFDQFRYLFPELYSDGRFLTSHTPYFGGLLHPHNEVAYLWVSGGLLALLGILAPILVFIVRTCSKNLFSLVVFIPLALHSNVEYPLYSASIHLIICLTGLFLIAEKYQVWRTGPQLVLKPSIHVGGSVSALICGLLLLETLAVVHLARINSFDWAQSHTYESYSAVREDDSELHHWVYGETARLVHRKNLAETAMATGRPEKVRLHLGDLKEIVRRYNKRGNWARLAAAYNGLGMRAHLIGFLEYVAKLDPGYAQELRAYYKIRDGR